MDSTVVLLLLLAGLGGAVVEGSPWYVSTSMDDNVHALEEPYNLKDTSLVPNPLFLVLLKDINVNLQKHEQILLLNATLDVYLKIFSRMLTSTQTPSQHAVGQHLQRLSSAVQRLKKHLGKESHLDLLLRQLASIKVDDTVVQRKALNEVREVYQLASQISRNTTDKHPRHTHQS